MIDRRAIQKILSGIKYRDYEFRVLEKNGLLFLQGVYYEEDINTAEPSEQHTRMWLLSEHMTKSEIRKCAYLMVTQSEEHRRREGFLVQDGAGNWTRPFGPHLDVEELMYLSRFKKHLDFGLYVEEDEKDATVVASSMSNLEKMQQIATNQLSGTEPASRG